MTDISKVYVFAYGSNLHLNRMQQRVSSARSTAIGFVVGRKLEFRKRSVDGSAKADAKLTNLPSDRLWGAIYSLSSSDKRLLDKHEYLGIGYDEELVEVITANGPTEAWIYQARAEAIDESKLPYTWYLDFVKRGAMQHRLPLCYINQQLNTPSTQNPDDLRRRQNQEICQLQ